MQKKAGTILCLILIFTIDSFSNPPQSTDIIKTDIVTISIDQQYEAVIPGSKSTLAINFQLAKDWHFYASAQTAPGGMNLKIKPSPENYIAFSQPIYPKPQPYFDKSLGKKLEVYSDRFTVFLPFTVNKTIPLAGEPTTTKVKINIEGAVCSDIQCRVPDFGQLTTEIKISPDAAMVQPKFTLPAKREASIEYRVSSIKHRVSTWFALGLALLAGLSLNIMPCVWPVLPLIVMRIIEQSKASKKQAIAMGLVFCGGILLFFACLAVANIILQLFYGTVLQWADQFRNPAFLAAMALLLVVLALFCFGVFSISIPSSISGKASSGKGYSGAVGMGFLAAILSTPCSFAILVAAFAWAQAQPLLPATLAIMIIGVGMALPYAILTSMPSLLNRLPKAGRWMQVFKQTVGFILLAIAVKLIAALPQERRMSVLYFAVILAFCTWMWGGWVSLATPKWRRWVVRITAIAIAGTTGLWLLPAPKAGQIDWQQYNPALIEQTIKQQKPVLIKFTADWCLTCKVVEKTVYARKDIAQLIKRKGVLAVKADTTLADSPATTDLKHLYNEPGVPVTILFIPRANQPTHLRGLLIGGKLKQLLESLPEKGIKYQKSKCKIKEAPLQESLLYF